jgi:hypothetical protein
VRASDEVFFRPLVAGDEISLGKTFAFLHKVVSV